jgi:hypothetical protein
LRGAGLLRICCGRCDEKGSEHPEKSAHRPNA